MDSNIQRQEVEEESSGAATPMQRRQSITTSTMETLIQAQSPLFGKLPFEIRSRIWECALDFGEPLHVILQKHLDGHRLRIADCERHWREYTPRIEEYPRYKLTWDSPTDDYTHGRCYEIFFDRVIPTLSGECWQPLSLLQSCRRIYAESIDLLYSLNKFEFSFPRNIIHFLSSVPSARLSKITSITLYGDLHTVERGQREDFERVVSLLEPCTGLDKVRFLIYDYLGDIMDPHTEWFMKQLSPRKEFKHGLWIERVTSFVTRDPQGWTTPSRYADSDDENESNQEEKAVGVKRLHYLLREKYRIDENGNQADLWESWKENE